MKKLVLFIVLLLNQHLVSKAQLYNWTKTLGSIGDEVGHFVTVDESTGNVYVLGGFQHTIDVDPGPAVYNLTSDSTFGFFIAKYTVNGSLIWARRANGMISCRGAQVASNGDLIFVGQYMFNAVFNPTQLPIQLPYIFIRSPYIAKYTSNGNIVYVKNIGGYFSSDYNIAGFKLDNTNNIVISISGHGEIDLDPSANLVYCNKDFALVKYDQNGNYLWSRIFGNWPSEIFGGTYAQSLDIDIYNNIYVVGEFSGTIDFSGGLGTGVLVGPSQNILDNNHFLCKFDSFGNLIFAKTTAEIIYYGTSSSAGNNLNYGSSTIRVNESGSEIFVAMQLLDTFNINPNGNLVIFLPTSEFDICLLKLDIAGNLIWNKQIISTIGSEDVIQMEMDLGGNIYLTGYYTGNIYFDPASTIVTAISLNGTNLFIAKLDGNGNYIWEWKAEHGIGNSIYLDDCENLYAAGAFSNQVNFSPSPGLDIKNSIGGGDAYILKYSKYRLNLLSQTNPTGCGLNDGTITLSGFIPSTNFNIYAIHNGTTFSALNLTSDTSGIIHIAGLGGGLYTQIYTLINGCKVYCNEDINLVSPAFNATLANQSQPTFCTATDGSISFSGFNPLIQYVVNYYFDGLNSITQNIFADNNGNILLNNLSLGTYSNFEFSALGCSSGVNDTIALATTNIGNNIALTATNPTSCIAANGTITIIGLLPNVSYSISYDYNGGLVSTSLSADANGSILISSLDTGSYTNIEIGVPGCSFITINSFEIVNPLAPAAPAIGNHVSFCSNNISPVYAPIGSGGVINWYSDAALTTPINAGISLNLTPFVGQQTYYVTETINSCESIAAPVLVTISELPSISFAGDSVTTCLTQMNLAANIPQVGVGEWSIITGAVAVTDHSDPTSLVTLSNGINILNWNITNGVCPVSSSQVKINVVPMAVSANILSNDICGKGNGKVSLSQNGGIAPVNYEWQNLGLTGNIQTNLTSGNYTILATDSQGCVTNFGFNLPVENTAVLEVGPDRLLYLGDSVYFNLPDQGAYLWSPDSTLSCNDCPNPIAFPKTNTTYLVEYTDSNGCFVNDKVTIKVDILCSELFIPTGFSPNGDGINDLECVHGDCFKYMVFAIYNRWGEKVFETTNPNLCWDGNYKGNISNEGVYTYYLNATTNKGEAYNKKGNITLIK